MEPKIRNYLSSAEVELRMLYIPYLGSHPKQKTFRDNVQAIIDADPSITHVDYVELSGSLLANAHYILALMPEMSRAISTYDIILTSSIGSPILQETLLLGNKLKTCAKIIMESGPTQIFDNQAFANMLRFIPECVTPYVFKYVLALGIHVDNDAGYDALADIPNPKLMIFSMSDPFINGNIILKRFRDIPGVTLIKLEHAKHLGTLQPKNKDEKDRVDMELRSFL